MTALPKGTFLYAPLGLLTGLIMAGQAVADPLPNRPDFKLPFPCGSQIELKTYYGHGPDDKKIDMYRYGVPTGSPITASAGGYVHEHFYPGGIEIRHGNGWFTTYLHMSERVSVGTTVEAGDWVGVMGNVASPNYHLHYEQLYAPGLQDAGNQHIVNPVLQGEWLYMDPENPLTRTSENCGGNNPPASDTGKYWVDIYADTDGHSAPGGPVSGTLHAGTSYVYCKKWGPKEEAGASYNHWWLKTDLDEGPTEQWISALMLSHWGNDEARDNDGRDLPECDYLPYGTIADAYYGMGGIDSPLGLPTQAEADAQLGGRYQRFENGIMLWHADTGAYPVYGQILEHFEQTGVEGTWGFPIMEERDAANSPATGASGRYQYFQSGLFLWTPQTGAHVVHGAFEDYFANNGREEVFGYPETDEVPDGNGVKQTFEKAVFYWDPQNWVEVQWR